MNLRDLRYIVAVAEHRNFSKAAEYCYVSQPTLSGQVKKLEETLGVQVFERTNKRVMLTPVGEQIVSSARRILHEVHIMEDIAEHARDPFAGNFRLGAFPTLATYIFPQIVPRIIGTMPELRLILVEEKTAALIEKLHQGALDAALLAIPVEDEQLDCMPLWEDKFFLAVYPDHPLAEAKQVRVEELAEHRLLLLDEGHCLRDQALEVCQLHGVGEEQDFRATGLETLRQMVRAGTGITLMPEIAINPQDTDIITIPFAPPAPSRKIGLFWRKTSARAEVMKALARLA